MSDLPTLILMCGLPRSGKSTMAREISKQLAAPIVCPDEVRLALHGREFEPRAEGFVWAITKTMVRALFGSAHRWVILDGCNNERKHRDEWDRPKEWDRRVVCMPTDEFTCIDRAHGDGCEHLVGVIERMARRQEPPEEIDLLAWESTYTVEMRG